MVQNNKKRILFFTTTSYIGGSEKNVLLLANSLSKINYEVYVASLEQNGPFLEYAKSKGLKKFNPYFKNYFIPFYISNIIKRQSFNGF